MPDPTPPLDRLFDELVRAARQAGVLDRPIAVRDLLDVFIPYRAVRPLRIAELHDDYLQLVMQLLAGEEGRVLADPELREACRTALMTRHPDLSLLRTFEERTVRVVPRATEDRAETAPGGDGPATSSRPGPPIPTAPPATIVPVAIGPDAGSVTETASAPPTPRTPSAMPPALPSTPLVRGRPVPASRPSRLSRLMGGTVPIVATRSAAVSSPTGSRPSAPEAPDAPGEMACLYCARALPGGRAARFCPWCGQHLLQRCRMCRTSLEEAWVFCITCGHPT